MLKAFFPAKPSEQDNEWVWVSGIEKVVGLTGFVIIHVFIVTFSPAQGECNQMVNTKFTRPVNEMSMSTLESPACHTGN